MSETWQALHTRHPRSYHENKFVYPVLSRRSRGLSIGINLNPDKVCNFDCIYCQVDRRSEAQTRFVETDRLIAELDEMLDLAASGEIFHDEAFRNVPAERRRVNDIALSGDGEPTTYRNFDAIIRAVTDLKRKHGLDQVKVVLITNASMFHKPAVQRGLSLLDENQGEIWAKLDAGTEAYFQLVERTHIPFQRILDNIRLVARVRPIVIQSLFMRIQAEPPAPSEIGAFCDRLAEIRADGGQIKLVQVYTVARPPAESFVTPLSANELSAIADAVIARTGIPSEVYAE